MKALFIIYLLSVAIVSWLEYDHQRRLEPGSVKEGLVFIFTPVLNTALLILAALVALERNFVRWRDERKKTQG